MLTRCRDDAGPDPQPSGRSAVSDPHHVRAELLAVDVHVHDRRRRRPGLHGDGLGEEPLLVLGDIFAAGA